MFWSKKPDGDGLDVLDCALVLQYWRLGLGLVLVSIPKRLGLASMFSGLHKVLVSIGVDLTATQDKVLGWIFPQSFSQVLGIKR